LMRLYLSQSWLARKMARYQRRKLLRTTRANELNLYGTTVHGLHDTANMRWA